MSTLDEYSRRFRHLHTARSAAHWPTLPGHRAPHKPLLLLSVMQLVEEGSLAENRVELTPELAESFARFWSCLPPGRERGRILYPFFHLRSEGFWHLVPQPGQEALLRATAQITSASQLGRLVRHATLEEPLFVLLTTAESRRYLREVLLEACFDAATRARLAQQAVVDAHALEYSRELLLGTGATRIRELPLADELLPKVRDQGFRRAVVGAYERRCALCGIRILTVEGHTAVDAAHIVPWSVSQDDRPTNGLALCRLCHWAFDEGMLGITRQFTLLTSPQLGAGGNIPAHLGPLNGRGILGPREERHWPDRDSLDWHRSHVFRAR